MLMPGRSLDTSGICVTSTNYQEISHTGWVNGGALDGSGGELVLVFMVVHQSVQEMALE